MAPKVINGSGGVRQGITSLQANTWHHLVVSYPGAASDINATRLYVDGRRVDASISSVDGVVLTSSGIDLRLGAAHDDSVTMSGQMDEVRLSNKYRGSAWAAYEYENQRVGGQLFAYDLEYQLAPILPEDLNLTIVRGQAFTYLIASYPPAFEYTLSGGILPNGVTLNSATGLLEGNTTDAVSDISLTLTASNANGAATASLNLSIQDSVTTPVIDAGDVIDVFGRGAQIKGMLRDAGGVPNQVKIYYGLSDAGMNTGSWENELLLGLRDQGAVEVLLGNLDSGKTYYYRFYADTLSSWSDVGSFSTQRFDQGILRIHTGDDEYGIGAGIFWDRNDGAGESKVFDANISSYSYLAPNGSSWKVSKAIFQISESLLFGQNLQEIRLSGVNALSFFIDGNLTVAKSFSGSSIPALPHLPGGTLTDGYDGYYADDQPRASYGRGF